MTGSTSTAVEPAEAFDVVVTGFEASRGAPEDGLARVFGIDSAAATKLIESVPVTVQRSVNRVRAEYFRRALEHVGAHVEVRNKDGGLEAPPIAAAAAARAAPASAPAPANLAAMETPQWQPLQIQAAQPMAAAPAALSALGSAPAAEAAGGWGAPASFEAPLVDARAIATTERPAAPATAHAGNANATQVAGSPGARAQAGAVAAAGAALAPGPSAANDTAVALRAPAHPTVREGHAPIAAAPAPAAPAATDERRYDHFATDQTQRAPLSAFRIGDTSAPFIPRGAPRPLAAPAGYDASPAPKPGPACSPLPPSAAAPLLAQPVAVPINLPAQPTGLYGGLPWGEIDRGRHQTGQHAPAQLGAAHALGLEGETPSLEVSQGEVAARPLVLPAPAAPPIAAAVGARIVAGEAMPAPSLDAIAAAMRKQAVLNADSNLGGAREVPKPKPISRWEQAASTPQSTDLATANAAANAVDGAPVNTPRALLSARHGRAEPMPGPGAAERPAPAVAKPAPRTRPNADDAEPAVAAPARARSKDTRPFWDTVGEALIFPVLGQGSAWIVTVTAWSIVGALIAFAASAVPGIGWIIAFAAQTSLLALCADFHCACLTAVTTGEKMLVRKPDLDPGRVFERYLKSGINLSLFMLVSQTPLVFWLVRQLMTESGNNPFELFLSPLFWLLAIGPAFYWPMAVTVASMHNDFGAVWYVPFGLRAVVNAPAEHFAIVVLGGVAFAASWLLFVLIGVASGLPPVFFMATIGLPLAVSHGVMGALAGHLVRARADVFS